MQDARKEGMYGLRRALVRQLSKEDGAEKDYRKVRRSKWSKRLNSAVTRKRLRVPVNLFTQFLKHLFQI